MTAYYGSLDPSSALWPQRVRFPVLVINLDRSVDRWRGWAERWPDAQRLPAVNGRELDLRALPPALIANRTRRNLLWKQERCEVDELNTVGALGCSLSHVRAMEAIQASGALFGVVLEDDASFSEDPSDPSCAAGFQSLEAYFRHQLCRAILAGDIPNDLGAFDMLVGSPFQTNERDPASNECLAVRRFLVTALHVYPAHACERLKSVVLPADTHIDRAYDLALQLGQLRAFGSPFFRCRHDEQFPSTIVHSSPCREERLSVQLWTWRMVSLVFFVVFIVTLVALLGLRKQICAYVGPSSSSSSYLASIRPGSLTSTSISGD